MFGDLVASAQLGVNGKVSVLEEEFVLQHELARKKWSLQCEADVVERLVCIAGDRGKELQKVSLQSHVNYPV